MVKKKKRNFSFSGKVADAAISRQKASSNFGYLNLPKEISTWSPTPGSKTTFDVIPYIVSDPKHPDRNDEKEIALVGDPYPVRPFYRHTGIGAANESVVCLTSINKKCPICEYRNQLIKEGADKKDTDALKSKARSLYLVIPLGSRKFDAVPHIFDVSQHLFSKLLAEELDENRDDENYPHPEKGKSLKVRWLSATMGNSKPFADAGRIDFVKREEQYDWDILDEGCDLDKVLKILSYKELEALFNEAKDDDDDEDEDTLTDVDDDDDEDTPKRKSKSNKRKKRDEEEDEEEDDDEEDEEEDDDKPKKRKSKSNRRKKQEDEEEEDEEDDDDEEDAEDEEEDEPKRRKSSRSSKKSSSKRKKKQKCPHGLRFGIDTEDYKACDTCDIWGDCIEVKERK